VFGATARSHGRVTRKGSAELFSREKLSVC